MVLSRIDHGFDGKGHAFVQHNTCAWSTIVKDLRVVVKYFRNTVAAKLPHHAEVVALCVTLNGIAYISQPGAWSNLFDAPVHAFLSNFAKSFRHHRRFSGEEHFAGVPMVAVLDDGNVNIDGIAIFKIPNIGFD